MDEHLSHYRWLSIRADHAFEAGYVAGLTGESAMVNPFEKMTAEFSAWNRGQGIGAEILRASSGTGA